MTLLTSLKRELTPESLDSVIVEIEGVKVHVFGVLHGITGAANLEYLEKINQTIDGFRGPRYCEKSMKSMYRGLDYDVDDWLVFRNVDAFRFSFDAFIRPTFWYHYLTTMIREKTTKSSRFGENGISSLSDIGGALEFHGIAPKERREYAGFPTPRDYMKLNALRWSGKVKKRFRFADKDFAWLESIEPNACIPYRSIHMIEYIVAHAKKHGYAEVAFFCGEIHNSDIEWIAEHRNSYPEFMIDDALYITERAQLAATGKLPIKSLYAKYLALLASGVASAFIPYFLIALSFI